MPADSPSPFTAVARELIERGEYDKALELLISAFRLSPCDESIRKSLIAAHAEIGKREFKRNRFPEAAAYFKKALELSPDNQEFGMLQGIALYEGKEYGEAARELEQSRRNGGDNLPLLFYLGRVYLESGDPARALSAWERALVIEPDITPLRAMVEKVRRGLATN